MQDASSYCTEEVGPSHPETREPTIEYSSGLLQTMALAAEEQQLVHYEEDFEEAHLTSNGRATHARQSRLSPCGVHCPAACTLRFFFVPCFLAFHVGPQ
jgi:hypothetical protein